MSSSKISLSFADQLFVLANITHVRDYRPTISTTPISENRKHLRLLDHIALLLVTEAKSDVAAVMFEQKSHEINFFYSKNRPTTSNERDYIESLKHIALSHPDIKECAIQLLARVIPTCRSKIEARVKGLVRSLPPDLHVCADTDGAFWAHLLARIPRLEESGLSAGLFLRRYIALVRRVNVSECHDDELEKLIRFGSIIGSYKNLKCIISSETTVRRVQKLGGYYTATKWIARTVDALRRTSPDYLDDGKINFREVRPPNTIRTLVAKDYVATLNRYGHARGLGPVTAAALKAAYPQSSTTTTPTGSPEVKVTHSVHAECTLAMHAIAMNKEWKYVEIGVSKGSCWLCEKFLGLVPTHNLQFLVSNFHGKLQPGWVCPVSTGEGERGRIELAVAEALEEIIEHTLNRRRSDSFPLSEIDGESQPVVEDQLKDDDLSWLSGN